MDYISAEEFLKQPKPVRKVLLDWWKPQLKDFFFRDFGNSPKAYMNGIYEGVIMDYETQTNATRNKTFLPLFTEGQLRNFIEEKLDGCNIYFESYTNGDTELTVEFEYNHSLEGDCDVGEIKVICDDMLDGYWQIACKIASE